MREEKILASTMLVQTQMYDQVARYNNVVLTLGYAGIFGIWTLISHLISDYYALIVALLVGISLLLYIGWTIYNSYHLTQCRALVSNVLVAQHPNTMEKLDALNKVDLEIAEKRQEFLKPYPLVFGASVVTGVIGGILLLIVICTEIYASWN